MAGLFPDSNVSGLSLNTSTGQLVGGTRLYATDQQDQAWFAGIQIPGRVQLDPGGGIYLLIDKVKPMATKGGGGLSRSLDVDGASLRILGQDPKEFSLTVLIWTQAQDDAWTSFVGTVWKKPGKATRVPQVAAEIRQVLLNKLGINQAALIDVTYAGPGQEIPSVQWRLKFQHSVLPTPRQHKKITGADALPLTKKFDNAPNAPPPAPSTVAGNASLSAPAAKPAGLP